MKLNIMFMATREFAECMQPKIVTILQKSYRTFLTHLLEFEEIFLGVNVLNIYDNMH